MCNKFIFFENFKTIADSLPDDLSLKFYKALTAYALYGEEPEEEIIKSLIIAIKPSLDKFEKRGGAREGAGAPQGNKNAQKQEDDENNQKQSKTIKNNQSEFKTINPLKKQETINKKLEDKKKNKQKEKISFSDVFDWESLITYWEENKKGGKYKTRESRQRMLDKLRELTGEDFELAKKAICHSVDNGYQGFCNGNELFFKPEKIPKRPPEQKNKNYLDWL